MSLISISADLPNLDGVIQAVQRAGGKDGLPYTKSAVRSATTDLIQRTWIEYASGVTVTYSGGTFKINVVTGDYIRSIEDGVRFPEDLTGEVFTTSPHGQIIEDGITPFDMKEKILRSPKAKTGKDGSKYITVPFRHGTPGTSGLQAMPKNVYAQAQKLGFSRRRGFLGRLITRQTYKWGDRLPSSSQGQRSHIKPHPGAGYTWSTGQYSGMVRMGKSNQTQYITFRRISTNSADSSWQHPGVKPRPIREAVMENTRDDVLKLIRRGFETDLMMMGLGGD